MLIAYSVNEKDAEGVEIRAAGYERQQTTLMLCCTADGRKLPVYIIFKRKTLPAREVFPKNVVVRGHENGWITSAMVQEWVRLAWQHRTDALLCKDSLVLD